MSLHLVAAVVIVTIYIIASYILWHYPTLLHAKKRIHFLSRHISHRGGAGEGYENTIRAYKNALSHGTEMLEIDVRLTQDGQVVVFHDESLLRLTGKNIPLSSLPYSKLPPLVPTIPIEMTPGSFFSDLTWPIEDRKIPLLSEVFIAFPNTPINIDIKDHANPLRLIHAVNELINKFNRGKITVWGSFLESVAQQCYLVNPETPLFFSKKRALLTAGLALTGLLPFLPIKETHYEVFLPLSLRKFRTLEKGKLVLWEKVVIWGTKLLVWKPMISHLKKRGIHVYLWTCNSDEEFKQCFECGADGIMTDRPSKLREYLNNMDKINS